MEIINYEKLKEKIKNYCECKAHIELYVKKTEEKERILNELFNDKSLKVKIGVFKIIRFDDITVLEYETIEELKNRKTDNLVVVGKDHSILKIEHHEPVKNLMYKQDTLSIYNENKRLISRIYIENFFYVIRVKILDKIKETNQYNKKDYTFYKDENETISLKISDEMYFKGENGFSTALSTAINLVNKISVKISDKLDEILGLEEVKEYKINRKKRG